MSFSIEELTRFGSPWSIFVNLLTDASGDLIIPTPLHGEPQGIAGDRFYNRHQIVVLGIAYNINGDAAGEGFRLFAKGPDLHEITLFAAGVPAANTGIANGFETFLALHGADPRASSPILDGYRLCVEKVGTPIAGSGLTVWGIHTTMPFDNYGYLGTPPITLPTA